MKSMKNIMAMACLWGFLFMFDNENQEVFRIEFDSHRIENHADKGLILIDSENPRLKPGYPAFVENYTFQVDPKGQGKIQDFILFIQVEKKD